MKTYKQVFSELKEQNRTALIPFFVIGDPDFDTSLKIVKTAIDAGADVLELGIPFSDPIADGPTIQRASTRALEAGGNRRVRVPVAAAPCQKHRDRGGRETGS